MKLTKGGSQEKRQDLKERLVRLARPFDRIKTLRMGLATLRHFQRQSCTSRAAEIAYWAILSSIPFGALLLTGLSLAATELIESGWSRAELHATVSEIVTIYLPTAIPQLEDTLGWLLGGQEALGLFGSIALLVTASLVFGAVSRSLTSIFGVKGRDRYTSTVLFTGGLCALAIIVIIGLPTLSALAPHIAPDSEISFTPLWLHGLADGILALAFAFLVTTVARAPVSSKYTLLGALLFVGSFEVARAIFSLYLGSLSKMHIVYGSFVGVMALIIWTYVVSVLLLSTMCLIRVLNDRLYDTPLGSLFDAP